MFADLAGWLRQPGAGSQGRDLGKAAMFLFSTTERPDTVQAALQYASRNTGVDFDYLLATAQRESNLDPAAQARTSSARGLFQFIESTWLATFKQAGPSHGYGDLAQRIEPMPRGGYRVSDPATREQILALRHDPKAAALMAGELTRSNGGQLQRALGRAPSPGELYIAHFLGARGASELIRLSETAPGSPAADTFPAAAKANRPIFYTGDGRPRSAREVHANLVARHGEIGTVTTATGAGKALGYTPARPQIDHAFHGLFSDLRPGSGLGPIARAVGAFWSGLFTTPWDGGTGAGEAAQTDAASPAGDGAAQSSASEAPSKPWRWKDPSLLVR